MVRYVKTTDKHHSGWGRIEKIITDTIIMGTGQPPEAHPAYT
jgi:hypothetical protein